MALSVEEIVRVAGGQLQQGAPGGLRFCGFIIDSRKAGNGELFIPLQGEKENGHKYIADALRRGAAGSLVERGFLAQQPIGPFPPGKAIIIVEDALKALQDIAFYHRSRFSVPVLAITGSNGKTTTKDFTAAVLAERYHVLKTEGNLNNHIGLPLMLLELNDNNEMAVLELGMSGSGEIDLLTSLSKPSVGIITNIGEAHMEYLGSKENIARAKGELLRGMSEEGTALLNGDDPYLRRLGEKYKGKVLYYGFGNDVHIQALGVRPLGEGSVITICLPDEGKSAFWIPLPGRHNAYNALAAIGAGLIFHLSPAEIQEGLENTVFSEMRMEKVQFDFGLRLINDAYNASPSSMRFALDYLKDCPGQVKIAVLGDMLELGSIAGEEHLQVGRYAADSGIDYLVTVGKLGALIARGAIEGGANTKRVFSTADIREAVGRLAELPLSSSVLLLKASRGMQLENIVPHLKCIYGEVGGSLER